MTAFIHLIISTGGEHFTGRVGRAVKSPVKVMLRLGYLRSKLCERQGGHRHMSRKMR